MRPACFLLITLFLLLPAHRGYAREPREFTQEFFRLLQDGKVPEAYDQLFLGSQFPAKKPEEVELAKTQTAAGLPLYGNILGVELIREEKIGGAIVRLVYLLKLELAPTVWEFYFYRPKADWFLVNVKFNDQFLLLQRME